MTKQEEINKMATTMCGFYNNGKCALRKDAPCDNVNSQDCYYKQEAEMLYDAGYRKGETYNYTATINHSYLYRINQLEYRLIEVRRETAKEILQKMKEKCKELENKFSHLCKSKKECLMETCRYEGVLAVKRELYELAKECGIESVEVEE